MHTCKHKVDFVENITETDTNGSQLFTWHLSVMCLICHKELTNPDEIVIALENVYTTDVANQLHETYKHKKGYLEGITHLCANGIKSSLIISGVYKGR